MRCILLALALLFPTLLHADDSTVDRFTIHPFKRGTNTMYAINGRPLERKKAFRLIKRLADFSTNCRVIIRTTGCLPIGELHSLTAEIKKFGFSDTYCLLIHEDQSCSIVNFTPSDDSELWVPPRCTEIAETSKESQQPAEKLSPAAARQTKP